MSTELTLTNKNFYTQMLPNVPEKSADYFIDRREAILKIVTWCGQLHSSPGHVLSITGEMNVGKSSLLNMALEIASQNKIHSLVKKYCSCKGSYSSFNYSYKRILATQDLLTAFINSFYRPTRLKAISPQAGAFGFSVGVGMEFFERSLPEIREIFKRPKMPDIIAFDTIDDLSGDVGQQIKVLQEFANAYGKSINIILCVNNQVWEKSVKLNELTDCRIDLDRFQIIDLEEYIALFSDAYFKYLPIISKCNGSIYELKCIINGGGL